MSVEKLDMSTKDLSQEHIKQIQLLFPNVVTEIVKDGKVTLGIDFDALKQELSDSLINDKQERYQMTWPDKSKAKLLANSKIDACLRPLTEKSVDFDNTKNVYIEGDNLDVLKVLRETYLGKIKMIYIDPPYNTGNDFVYNDDFSQSNYKYQENSGQYDAQGNRLVQNQESNGRFHSDWLNMIYPRLKISRDLLTDDGVIFISIDDNEIMNLKKICDEIFGEKNFIACIPRLTSAQRPSQEKYISTQHDYILMYSKVYELAYFEKTIIREDISKAKKDDIGLYIEGDTSPILASATQGYSEGGDYDFLYNGVLYKPETSDGIRRRWLWTKTRMEEAAKLGILKPTKKGLRVQNYINKEFQLKTNVMVDKNPNLILASCDFISSKYANNHGTSDLNKYHLNFDFSKPAPLLIELMKLVTKSNDIILDFFSGSATTADAVMQLNAEDGGHRNYILVQLQENIDEKSEAYKAGYKTICDIGEERIRRAGNKIKEDNGILTADLDTGFRVFKLDSSNMNDVYYSPTHTRKDIFETTIDNIKPDRTGLDLLFQVMLELGVELSAKIEEKEILGKKCYFVNDNDIVACFDDNLTNELLTELAKTNPVYAVFKDSCFNNDSVAINNEQIFKTYSPSTKIKVL